MTSADPDGQAQAWVVDPEYGGTRLDLVLAELAGCSRSAAGAHIDDGRVTVDDAAARRSTKVQPGQVVALTPPPAAPRAEAPSLPPIRWEDDHLLVVSKPAGLVVHAGAGHEGDTLVDALRAEGVQLAASAGEDRAGIVHRLDRDTSGLLVVAKDDPTRAGLAEQLRDRTMGRHYLALVEGSLPGPRGRVDAPLGRHPTDRTRFAVVESGRHAVTHWRELAVGHADEALVTLVACRLETGRTHQIRVHLSEAGTPIVGDRTYRARRGPAAALGLERFFLHAASLSFRHPITGRTVTVVEPLPDDLRRASEAAGIDPDTDVHAPTAGAAT